MLETFPTVSPSRRQAPSGASPLAKRVVFRLDDPSMTIPMTAQWNMDYDSADQENITPVQRPQTRGR